jgi:hypothetical protein
MSGAIAAAHHPSIFASVRPATKTAFLLIKDSPPFFFLSASFFLTATMMIRVSSPRACEIRGFFPQAKAQRSGKTRKTQAQRLFLD